MARTRRHLCALAAAMIAPMGVPALAQPAALPAEQGGASELPRDREALLALIASAGTTKEAMAARARLIEVAPDDVRAPTWMVEQAAAVLDGLAADGTEAAVLFGIPTLPQRERAEAGASEALGLVARAQDVAGDVVTKLQSRLIEGPSDPERARRRAEEAERALAQLVDIEQGVRIPYFRGRAAVILAALEPQRSAREDFARVTLESVGRLQLGTVAAESSRRVTLGAVLLVIGSGDRYGGGQSRKQARELLQWVVDQPAQGDGPGEVGGVPDPLTRVQAWMGLLRAAETVEELRGVREALALASITAPFIVDHDGEAVGRGEGGRSADPLLALLTAEAATGAMLAMPTAEAAASGGRAGWLGEAFAPLLALLTREDLREHRPALRALTLAKIGVMTDRLMPMAELDATIPFARAVSLARGATPKDPRRDEAAALLEAVADRADAGAVRAEALWELAVISWERGGPEDAVRAVAALCRLATEFPDSPRAAEAAEKAVEMSRYTLAQFSTTPPADRALTERLSALYAKSLEVAVKLSPSDVDSSQQRLERARLVLDAAAAGSARVVTPEELDAALSALEGVPEADPKRAEADALALAAIDRALQAAGEAVARAVVADAGKPALAPVARERQIALARRGVQWAVQRRPGEADRYRLALADALLDAGDTRAMAIYQDIVDRGAEGAKSGRADLLLRSRLGLGRAQRAARQSEDAFATLRGIVDELERAAAARRPITAERHPVYWLAWAEMLEILSADNRDGRRTDTIRLQVNRLALVDPKFGGGEGGRRIEAVKASIGP